MALPTDLLSASTGMVFAYVDPGTTTSLFALLTPLLAMLGIFFGFLLWPFRKALSALFGKRKQAEETAEPQTGEDPVTEEKKLDAK